MHGLECARLVTQVLLGGLFPVFELCGSDRPDSIGVGVHFIFDAFSAQTVVYCWDHPRRDENCEEFDIPDQLASLLDVCLRDASHLPINNSGVFEAQVELPEPIFFYEHECQVGGSRFNNLSGGAKQCNYPFRQELDHFCFQIWQESFHFREGRSHSWRWHGTWESGCRGSFLSSAAFARGVPLSGTSRVCGTLAGMVREGCTLHPLKKKIPGREIISCCRPSFSTMRPVRALYNPNNLPQLAQRMHQK